ncbi:hypothetical protein CRUP_023770 [Coryphaenoides rupestris]|nr:hypothetical protein CRUP_023770 [Coryphaenoides rupestris]
MGNSMNKYFKECIGFIHECRLNGGACLVHCLAGVSRSTTMVVAYLMTVTPYSWDECLTAVKAVRSYVGPNYGFQQQLQEYQMTKVSEYRAWLRDSFKPSPFKDEEQVAALLQQFTQQHQQEEEEGQGPAERHHGPALDEGRGGGSGLRSAQRPQGAQQRQELILSPSAPAGRHRGPTNIVFSRIQIGNLNALRRRLKSQEVWTVYLHRDT